MATTRNYFQKFPTISYNDFVIRDISVRTKLTQYLLESGIALLPYTIKEGERADSIASFYYKDPYYAWVIYLVNGIIDPYSEWPKDSRTLDEYITSKYGSFENALDTIVRYEVNWVSDTTILSPAQYEALPQEKKKYWEAQFGYNDTIISYFRGELDWAIDNNRLDQITVISNSSVNSLSNSFSIGERLYQYNYLNDVAVKSTVISIDSTKDANTIALLYTNSTSYEINFTSGNTFAYVKSTKKILPKSIVSGDNIHPHTYVKHIIDGSYIELSVAPTGNPVNSVSYSFSNPSKAVLTVQKVDFSDVVFASNTTLAAPNSFFTYEYKDTIKASFMNGSTVVTPVDTSLLEVNETIDVLSGSNSFSTTIASITNSTHMVMSNNANFTGTGVIFYGISEKYHDEGNYVVGRKNAANVIVISHDRLDTNSEPVALLSNSQLSVNELDYWKPINAYDDEVANNERRKEIYVLDIAALSALDDNLEALTKNV